MFDKKVYITELSIIVGKNEIEWSKIVGIRIQSGENLESLYPDLPIAELFLEYGRVTSVSNRNIFFIVRKSYNDVARISCKEAIKIVEKNAVNVNPALKNWIEWRLFVPIIFIEIISTFIALLKGMSIDNLVMTAILAGIAAVPLGFIWERKARRNILKR